MTPPRTEEQSVKKRENQSLCIKMGWISLRKKKESGIKKGTVGSEGGGIIKGDHYLGTYSKRENPHPSRTIEDLQILSAGRGRSLKRGIWCYPRENWVRNFQEEKMPIEMLLSEGRGKVERNSLGVSICVGGGGGGVGKTPVRVGLRRPPQPRNGKQVCAGENVPALLQREKVTERRDHLKKGCVGTQSIEGGVWERLWVMCESAPLILICRGGGNKALD